MNLKDYNETRQDLFCRYCGKQCKNFNSLKQHEIRCKNNPNRIECIVPDSTIKAANASRKGMRAWNSGLTKETDPRITASSNKISEKMKLLVQQGIITGRASTEEKELNRRLKISQSMKQNPKAGGLRKGSGIGHKGWYKGYFCDSTYELAYIVYNIDHNIHFERCKLKYEYMYNNKLHLYHPDFILSDGSLVEIKGYHSEQVDAKINSVNDRPIKILYREDLQYAYDYIFNNYKIDKLEDLYEKLN